MNHRKSEQRAIDNGYGKIPPQCIEIEEAVIGAMLIDSACITEVADTLKPEHFYKETHRVTYEAIMELHNSSRSVDMLTVIQALKSSGNLDLVGGAYAVSKFTQKIATSINIDSHSKLIIQEYIRRETILEMHRTVGSAYNDQEDIFDIINGSINKLSQLVAVTIKKKEAATRALFDEFKKHIKEAKDKSERGIVSGVPTTISELDSVTNGWQPGDLIIIAARPGMGKTAFTKACIMGAVDQLSAPVAMFSLEMPNLQIISRIISEHTGIPSNQYLKGDYYKKTPKMEIDEIEKKFIDKNGKELLIVDDASALTIQELRIRALRINQKYNPALFIVDYLQLAKGTTNNNKNFNREQEVSEISRGLKQIAKDTKKPVIALAQLSRATESRGGDMRPKLSDLRDSGSIEQDADGVIFIYRPEYYRKQGQKGFEHVFYKGKKIDSHGVAQLIVAKNRNGQLDSVTVKFIDTLTKFESMKLTDAIPDESPDIDGVPF